MRIGHGRRQFFRKYLTGRIGRPSPCELGMDAASFSENSIQKDLTAQSGVFNEVTKAPSETIANLCRLKQVKEIKF